MQKSVSNNNCFINTFYKEIETYLAFPYFKKQMVASNFQPVLKKKSYSSLSDFFLILNSSCLHLFFSASAMLIQMIQQTPK